MKCFNLKAIIGMGFLTLFFAPVWAYENLTSENPELVCRELVTYIENRAGDPHILMSKVVTCLSCHQDYQEAASMFRQAAGINNPLVAGKLIENALAKLPPTPAVNLLRSRINGLSMVKRISLGMTLKKALPR